jgi:hypothetical protein
MSRETFKVSELATRLRGTMRDDLTKARRNLRLLDAVAKVWPAEVRVNQFHAHNLYGSVASAKIGDDFTGYGMEDTRPTMARVIELLRLLPPVPMVVHKVGGASFRPAEYVDERYPDADPRSVFPVIIEIDPGVSYGASQVVTWFTKLDGAGIVEINAHLRPESQPVRVQVNAKRDRGTGKVLRVESTDISVNPSFAGNFWMDQRVRYAAGNYDQANRFVLYWLDQEETDCAKVWAETICGIDYAAEG